MKLPIFFNEAQVVKDPWDGMPSSSKAGDFMRAALERHASDIEVMPVRRAEPEGLKKVHLPRYVDGVIAGERSNGFGHYDHRVPLAAMWSCGSMCDATLHAMRHGVIACSPTSGFHHAGHREGGGFCTFNGLALAAVSALEAGARRVAILDLDWHWGDGTQDILEVLELGEDRVLHVTSGERKFSDSGYFFRWLMGAVRAINQAEPDVVIYQAGADMHRKDPLGGLLSDSEMAMRDLIVFRGIKSPIAWNLAGGYRGEETIDTHLATLAEAIASGRPYPPRQTLRPITSQSSPS